MSRKQINLFIIAFVIFLFLIFYNQNQAKNSFQNTKESSLSIHLLSYPESLKVGNGGQITWKIDAPSDLSTNFTTVYWSENSSPSALTKNDSPSAVGYTSYLPDYTSGIFYLPNKFSVSLDFTKPKQIWFRVYANVGGNHLWSEEKLIIVNP